MKNESLDSFPASGQGQIKNQIKPTHFGYGSGYLDISTLSYRWFGAIWCWKGELRLILGYWFADTRDDLITELKQSGWHEVSKTDQKQIKEVYHYIRSEQERQDWERRSRLPLSSILKKSWRGMKPGWYIIQSSSQYPLIASCIKKTQWFVWLEHVRVCENTNELRIFIDSINQKHGISLDLDKKYSFE